MLGVILGALLPVIVTLALGMLAGWRRDEDTQAAESLNRMVLVYALPLALFAGTITVSRQELVSEWPLLVALLAGTVLPFVAAFLVDRTVFGRSMEAAALQAMAFGFPAIACVLTDIRLPGVVTGSFKLLGSTVGGISLFASGIILQSQPPQFSLPAAISTLARLLVIPVLAFAALTAAGQAGELRKMTVLALGLAAAPMQVILSSRYRTDEKENASVLLYSNVLSIPTLAFLIWLTQ